MFKQEVQIPGIKTTEIPGIKTTRRTTCLQEFIKVTKEEDKPQRSSKHSVRSLEKDMVTIFL